MTGTPEMTGSQPSTRTRSDSLRSALRAIAPRARARPSSTPTTDAEQHQSPRQKDAGAAPRRHRAATRNATNAPAESVRVVDKPAEDGAGRSFLVERGLTSQAELEGLVADYVAQSELRDELAALVRIGDDLAVRGARTGRRHV